MLGEEKEKIDVLVLVCGFEDLDLSSNSGFFSGENIHFKSHALFQVDTLTARPACPLRPNNMQPDVSHFHYFLQLFIHILYHVSYDKMGV